MMFFLRMINVDKSFVYNDDHVYDDDHHHVHHGHDCDDDDGHRHCTHCYSPEMQEAAI